MLNKVLIANRGEIAIRIMRACKELGVATVAVFSEADRDALFVRYADEKFCIGPPPASKSYLQIDKIIEVALESGAEGIHPGYGFLAENVTLCRKCKENGIEFIGPPVDAMELMGSKIESKKSMIEAGVHVVPGLTNAVSDHEKAKDYANEIGYPVMLKASAGGGGIGIRRVDSGDQMETDLESIRQLAKSSFGDDAVLIEKFIEDPRHIEFQVIGDKKGKIIHVNERECSIQRRHQKLIEETPSCALTDEKREEMGSQAVLAAKTAGYYNAGTCEFMYKDGDYYFLEMNTRLQVEHPITEMITGVDLAQEQLRVASGLPLQYGQEDIRSNGWSMECRINAEDPLNDFKPSPGKILKYAEPGGPGIRVDSGVYQGFTIPPYYDSMVAKLIIWAPDRKRGFARAKRALWEYQIGGIKHNIPFHQVMLDEPVFIEGKYDTSFIPRYNIQEKVVEFVKEQHSGSRTKKVAAAMAAVEAQIASCSTITTDKPKAGIERDQIE